MSSAIDRALQNEEEIDWKKVKKIIRRQKSTNVLRTSLERCLQREDAPRWVLQEITTRLANSAPNPFFPVHSYCLSIWTNVLAIDDDSEDADFVRMRQVPGMNRKMIVRKDRGRALLSIESLEDLKKHPVLHNAFQKAELLIMFHSYLESARSPTGQALPVPCLLHRLVAESFPRFLIYLAGRVYPQQLLQRDAQGRLPLHVAIQSATSRPWENYCTPMQCYSHIGHYSNVSNLLFVPSYLFPPDQLKGRDDPSHPIQRQLQYCLSFLRTTRIELLTRLGPEAGTMGCNLPESVNLRLGEVPSTSLRYSPLELWLRSLDFSAMREPGRWAQATLSLDALNATMSQGTISLSTHEDQFELDMSHLIGLAPQVLASRNVRTKLPPFALPSQIEMCLLRNSFEQIPKMWTTASFCLLKANPTVLSYFIAREQEIPPSTTYEGVLGGRLKLAQQETKGLLEEQEILNRHIAELESQTYSDDDDTSKAEEEEEERVILPTTADASTAIQGGEVTSPTKQAATADTSTELGRKSGVPFSKTATWAGSRKCGPPSKQSPDNAAPTNTSSTAASPLTPTPTPCNTVTRSTNKSSAEARQPSLGKSSRRPKRPRIDG